MSIFLENIFCSILLCFCCITLCLSNIVLSLISFVKNNSLFEIGANVILFFISQIKNKKMIKYFFYIFFDSM